MKSMCVLIFKAKVDNLIEMANKMHGYFDVSVHPVTIIVCFLTIL